VTRAVLVTGASTGIGAACARRLDALGWRVFAGVRREADAVALRAGASPRLVPVRLDVTDAAEIAAAAATIDGGVGEAGLAGVVNNAGVAVAGPLECVPVAALRQQLEINVVGLLAVTQACLPMLRRARGRVVLMGSIAGRSATPFLGPYSASKHALEALADALRVELAPWGIVVSLVEPGAIATPIWTKSADTADRTLGAIDRSALARYEGAMAAVRKAAEGSARRAIPADRVADVVVHALTARRPRTRYLVGLDARLQVLLRLLPDRVRDQLVARFMGLPGGPTA
jgi:NAD(P)-dependent dehydrogenase (short-subunit alcohol dehydrogenase family)